MKTLQEILSEAMDLKGLNLDKLSALTDIPSTYLNAIYKGDFEKLPSYPYVRGYLQRIADALDVDKDLLWRSFKNEYPLKTSGSQDKLPANRFAIKPINKKTITICVILFFVVIYLFWRVDDFRGIPALEINNPVEETITVDSPSIVLSGEANPKDKLTINGEEVFIGDDGRFEKSFSLQPNSNTIEFKVKRFLGKGIVIIKHINYQIQ